MSEVLPLNSIQEPKVALEGALNFQELRKIGLATISLTGSQKWTDYNAHDPGITILENLTFGLTDLAYRTDFPIEDILAQQELSAEALAAQQFYTARSILTNDPVTFKDLRKIFIDQSGIDNAWIQKNKDSLNVFGGMIDILIDPTTTPKNAAAQQALVERVKQTYYSYKALGQDLGQIIIRQPLEIILNLELVLTPNAMAEQAVAKVLTTLEAYIAGTVNFLSLQEMLKVVGGDINQVFDGPPLNHGFLPDKALAPIKKRLRAPDLIPIITAVPEVVLVPSLKLLTQPEEYAALVKNEGTKNAGTAKGGWLNQLVLPRRFRPVLVKPEQHQFSIKKGDTPCELNLSRLKFEYKRLKSQERKPKLAAQPRDLPIPVGRFRDVNQYFSIQQEFPQIYHLAPFGPPPNATEAQLGQIKQFQGYLLFFDQLMSNYLAQLSNLGQLFSWDTSITRTYYYQGLDSAVANLGELLFDYPIHQPVNGQNLAKKALEKYKQKLAEFREDEATFLDRRNRFLNHLLARFGRNISSYLEHINATSKQAQQKEAIATKLRLLNHYPAMSARRGRAYNRYIQKEYSEQFSGLRQWVERVLDMAPENEANLHFNKRFVQSVYKDKEGLDRRPFSKYVLATDDGSPLDLKEVMRIGRDKENYRIDATPDKGHHVLLYKNTNPNQPATVYLIEETFNSVEKALGAIAEMVDLIGKFDKTSERIHLVEHILLRPTPIEPYFGLQLLDNSGVPWMQTEKWYTKDDLTQITSPPAKQAQFYYCIKTETSPKPPCSKVIIDKKKSTPGHIVHKTIYPKYIFFIEPIDLKAPVLRYQIKLLFGKLGKVIRLSSIHPFETKDLAKLAIDNWMSRLKQHFHAQLSSSAIAPLWKPLLKPWQPTPKKTKGTTKDHKDPYSFIFSVVIPDWPSRFQQKSFQKALEKIISLESPAHLLPNIIWLDKTNMQIFERRYASWWDAFLKDEPDAYCFREELMEFIIEHSAFL